MQHTVMLHRMDTADGKSDGPTDGRMDGRTDGPTDRRTDGPYTICCQKDAVVGLYRYVPKRHYFHSCISQEFDQINTMTYKKSNTHNICTVFYMLTKTLTSSARYKLLFVVHPFFSSTNCVQIFLTKNIDHST